MVKFKRFDVCVIKLDPTVGSEIKKTRPCVIISPDPMNESRLNTAIVAPMTSAIRKDFPTRVLITFQNKPGQIALDQLRTIDRTRITKNVGTISKKAQTETLKILQAIFL